MADYTAPTWEYVQTVISENIRKSEDAIRMAQDYMGLISQQYTAIQNNVPTDWFVDTNVGTDAELTWSSPVPSGEAVILPEEPDYNEALPAKDVAFSELAELDRIEVGEQPEWDFELADAPTAPDNLEEYTEFVELAELPTIDVDVPAIDVQLLNSDFVFNEATYAERVSQENKVEILRVLGGDLGIPQVYWDDLWAKAAGDLAEQQVGLARNARNRGAASHWGLPTEAVLTASRAVQDEANKKLQLVRIEQAQKQAELAHDDFWKAVDAALKYEQQWIDFHNQVQSRALEAAKAAETIAVQVHNSNVARYNTMLGGAKIESEVLKIEVDTLLREFEGNLRINQMQIERNKAILDQYQTEVQVYSTTQTLTMQAMIEKMKHWTSSWGADVAYKTVSLEEMKANMSNYQLLLSKIEVISRATATMLQARTGVSEYALKNQLGVLSQEEKINAVNLDVSRLTQQAQEINGKLQIAQVEWLGGQGNSLLQNLGELATGLAQALITVSDVNLGSGYSASDSSSTTASRNAEKVW